MKVRLSRAKNTEVKRVEVRESRAPWREAIVEVTVRRVDGDGWSDVEIDAMDAACDKAAKVWGLSDPWMVTATML